MSTVASTFVDCISTKTYPLYPSSSINSSCQQLSPPCFKPSMTFGLNSMNTMVNRQSDEPTALLLKVLTTTSSAQPWWGPALGGRGADGSLWSRRNSNVTPSIPIICSPEASCHLLATKWIRSFPFLVLAHDILYLIPVRGHRYLGWNEGKGWMQRSHVFLGKDH